MRAPPFLQLCLQPSSVAILAGLHHFSSFACNPPLLLFQLCFKTDAAAPDAHLQHQPDSSAEGLGAAGVKQEGGYISPAGSGREGLSSMAYNNLLVAACFLCSDVLR